MSTFRVTETRVEGKRVYLVQDGVRPPLSFPTKSNADGWAAYLNAGETRGSGMSYSRWATKWPGGGDSWYIYHDVDGTLRVYPPNDYYPRLNKRDTEHLRDLLNQALEDWDTLV